MSSTEEILPLLGSGYRKLSSLPSGTSAFRNSNRIEVQENEDSARSHYFSKTGVKSDSEDLPDTPMQMDFDLEAIMKSCNLRSDEIPFLLAEKPSSLDSDETEIDSEVDATIPMIYSPIPNTMSDSVLFSPDLQMERAQMKSLEQTDEQTSSSSNENDDWGSQEQGWQLLSHDEIESESDLEEFSQNSGQKLDSIEGNGLTDRKADDITISLSPNGPSEMSKSMPKSHTVRNAKGDRKTEEGYSPKENSDHKEGSTKDSPHQSDDQQRVKRIVEKALLNSTVTQQSTPTKDEDKLLPKQDGCGFNTEGASLENSETVNTHHEIPQIQDSSTEVMNADEEKKPVDFGSGNKTEGKNEDDVAGSRSKLETKQTTKLSTKKLKKASFTMEPVAVNHCQSPTNEQTQYDLSTALRFMAEVYPSKDEDELYFDSLSMTDVAAEMSENPKAAISEDHQGISKNDLSRILKTASSTLEPVPGEKEGAAPKQSRNKFSKFFKSFKNKWTKKA